MFDRSLLEACCECVPRRAAAGRTRPPLDQGPRASAELWQRQHPIRVGPPVQRSRRAPSTMTVTTTPAIEGESLILIAVDLGWHAPLRCSVAPAERMPAATSPRHDRPCPSSHHGIASSVSSSSGRGGVASHVLIPRRGRTTTCSRIQTPRTAMPPNGPDARSPITVPPLLLGSAGVRRSGLCPRSAQRRCLRSCRERRSSWVQVTPESRIPGASIATAASSIASTTARCVAASPTAPNVRPNGWATKRARDGLTIAVISTTWVSESVHSPASSKSRWSSPTDCWQTGQAGARSTRSVRSSTSCRATAGALCSRSGSGSAT